MDEIKLKIQRIELKKGSEWDVTLYPNDGLFIINNQIWAVSNNKQFVMCIGDLNQFDYLNPAHQERAKQEADQSKVSEDKVSEEFALNMLSVALHKSKI